MKAQTLIQAIHTATIARDNCERSGNAEWLDRWTDRLHSIVADRLPSGSGFDAGTTIESVTPSRVTFVTSYHHMDDGGSYDGWTEHRVIVVPTFDGIAVRVTGSNRNDIKEFIVDTFHACLTEPYEY